MRQILSLILTCAIVGCGDDDSPTGPGEELVGTWVGVSTTADFDEIASVLWTFRPDGASTYSVEFEGETVSFEETWAVVDGKLVTVTIVGGESRQSVYEFTVRGDRLTLINIETETVEVYERRS